MLEYFQNYYLNQQMGPGYVMTNIFYAVAVVLLLRPVASLKGRAFLRSLLNMFLLWVGSVVICGIGYSLLGQSMIVDRIMMILLLLIYAVFGSAYKPVTRLVRSFVFFSCMLHIIPISEPIGEWFKDIDTSLMWMEHFTWVIVIGLAMVVLLFMRRYSTEDLTFVPTYPSFLLCVIASIGIGWQMISPYLHPERIYNIPVAVCFFAITVLGYFMFYNVSREYDTNLELMAIQHKQALDTELLSFSQESYGEMHKIRHEIRNHLNYIRLMAESGEYQKLKEYVAMVCGETEKIFQFVECGNHVINAVMNHMIRQGESLGIKVSYQIVAPPEMPFRETEFCSLLSNLLENALEAAAQSGEPNPEVVVRIWPQHDYLFIHVENPVNDSVSPQLRLSLRSTKGNPKTHGYGTKIIRDLVMKYQGSVRFDMKEGRFTADVMLCLVQKEKYGQDQFGNMR